MNTASKKPHQKKRLNHTIPKFLLNRFASQILQKKAKTKQLIFEIPKIGSPRERATSQVAVQSYFYGRDSTELEDALMLAEDRFATILREVDAGADPNQFGSEISHYVWLQAVRTPALRNQASTAFTRVLSGVGEYMLSDAGQQEIIKHAEMNFEQILLTDLKKTMPTISSEDQAKLAAFTNSEEFRRQLTVHLDAPETKQSTNRLIAEFLRRAMDPMQLALMTERGHNSATAELVKQRSVPPDLQRATWRLVEYSTKTLILGDACTFYSTTKGEVSPVLRAGMEWLALYMPISKNSALVAETDPGQPHWEAQRVNRASASCSHRYLYASSVLGEIEKLQQLIGTNTAALTEEEFLKLISR